MEPIFNPVALPNASEVLFFFTRNASWNRRKVSFFSAFRPLVIIIDHRARLLWFVLFRNEKSPSNEADHSKRAVHALTPQDHSSTHTNIHATHTYTSLEKNQPCELVRKDFTKTSVRFFLNYKFHENWTEILVISKQACTYLNKIEKHNTHRRELRTR